MPNTFEILIVDDNRDFLRFLSLELSEGTRWGISTAQSATEAERIGSGQAIDFALLDLILPDGNGIDLGAKLSEQHSGIHVALMTGGELTTAEESQCRKYRFDIVNKPFLPQLIVSLVEERVIKMTKASA